MSDDLVTWLREAASRHNNYRCDEAADRIEELEREKMSWKGVYDGAITAMTERIEALEAALKKIALHDMQAIALRALSKGEKP